MLPVRQVPVREASAEGVKDFTEKQELKQKQNFIHFSKGGKGPILRGISPK
jgi:hypothetical protein